MDCKFYTTKRCPFERIRKVELSLIPFRDTFFAQFEKMNYPLNPGENSPVVYSLGHLY